MSDAELPPIFLTLSPEQRARAVKIFERWAAELKGFDLLQKWGAKLAESVPPQLLQTKPKLPPCSDAELN